MGATGWNALSTCAAVLAAGLAWTVFRTQSRYAGYELARLLHQELTNGEAARCRLVLQAYLEDETVDGEAAAREILATYFSLLWTFERILAGRRSLVRQQPWAATKPAVRLLDSMIGWHLGHWLEDLPSLRDKLRRNLPELHDTYSYTSFDDLVEEVRPAHGGSLPPHRGGVC